MSNFKFHLVTVIGIFLALAVGIFIGSSFTEESIILQQRRTIDELRNDVSVLKGERNELLAEAGRRAEAMALMNDWLGDMTDVYWLANPTEKKALLIHDNEFGPELLGNYLAANVVQTEVVLQSEELEAVNYLARAFLDEEQTPWLGEGISIVGELRAPDIVLLGLPEIGFEAAKTLAQSFLEAGIPVVALGKSGWDGLSGLVQHPLYASVSHFDTPMGLYCLGAIFQGQTGHYGVDNILPRGGLGR